MECYDGLEWEMYMIQHLFRNECCNVLAELFVRELRNSSFIMDLLERNREDTLSKSLFRLLKNVSSKGKKKAMRKDKVTTEEPESFGCTQHLNNLRDNEVALSSIFVRQLLLDGGEADVAVERLRSLDSAFLLCILTNDILQFNHNNEVKDALKTLMEIRNSIHHRDDYKGSSKSASGMLDVLRAKTKFLYSFLGRDNTSLQNYISRTQSNFCTPFREIQREIHKSYCDSILPKYSYKHNIVQPFIKHLRGRCQPDEVVENLMEFLSKNRLGVSEEPRPVLLCGAPRVGKSSILNCLLLNNICEEEQSNGGNFPLVVRVDEAETARNRTREMFWNKLLDHLTNSCPQAVQKYGYEEVVSVLTSYSCRKCFLFVVDVNLHDTKSLNHLMPYIDRGMWVLSYQGVPEPSSFYHMLKVESLTERQVAQLLREINMPEDKRNHVSELYRMCDYKGLIDTPDMAHLFADVCLEMRDSVPFYKLIRTYIYSNIDEADENERELIKLGKEAFKIIKENKKYYTEPLDNIKSGVWQRFLEQDRSRGFSFKYRVVEDYLAAKYVVTDTKEACDLWLEQPTLFKRVFEIVCSLWSKEENGIQTNLPYIRKYLETLFGIIPSKKRKRKKKSKVEPMETDETDFDGGNNQNNFVQWKYLSKLAVDNQNNENILVLLAGLLASKKSWLFKCKSLTEKGLVDLCLVFRHVNLTKELTIKLESGPNVAMLIKVWGVLSDHPGVCSNTTVQLVIHHTDKNWIMHEKSLTQFSSTLVQTKASLYITKYVGPLLCSGTEQFLNCLCMKKLDVLDVYVCDLGSLHEVLAHRKKLRSIIVRLSLRIEETKIPNTKIELFAYPLNLTITYFEDLQKLLDRIEPPHHLSSLRIYRVYIHKKFSLDLRRFTRLKFLSIKFLHMGTLPSVFLEEPQDEKMEIDDIQDYKKVTKLSLEQWTLQLQLNLRLPESLERLLMRNLTFCDDSNVSVLNKYWSGLPYQRLVLLDTYLSISKFKEILRSLVTDYQVEVVRNNIKKCRLEEHTESHNIAVKQERLGKEEREKRRQNKPEGKEVIITSDVKLCSDCHLLSCSCVKKGINRSQDTYRDFVTLLNDIYSYKILSISYSSRDIVVRKDMCGDLHVQCPLAFLNDDTLQQAELAEAQWPTDHQELQELSMVLGALALVQAIGLTHTCLSHEGAFSLVQYLKERKKQFGRIEPFRLTIFSRYYHNRSKSVAEVEHSAFIEKVKSEDCLQQFNFRCDCMKRCHNFKKSINGKIFFNDTLISER